MSDIYEVTQQVRYRRNDEVNADYTVLSQIEITVSGSYREGVLASSQDLMGMAMGKVMMMRPSATGPESRPTIGAGEPVRSSEPVTQPGYASIEKL